MVLTAAQATAFFESPDQMVIPHATMVQMQLEGIQSVADLADFEKDSLQQLADNLRKPGGRIPDPDPNEPAGATIPMPAFTYGAKSQKRLTVACDLIRYYQTVGRVLTAANIQWNQVMSNFEIQWKANKILSKVQKSFWSCTHVNSCQKYALYINLHILLNILSKTTQDIQESRKSIK